MTPIERIQKAAAELEAAINESGIERDMWIGIGTADSLFGVTSYIENVCTRAFPGSFAIRITIERAPERVYP